MINNLKNLSTKKKIIIASIIAVIVAVFLFFPKGLSGTYRVSAFIYDGWDLSDSASGSFIKVNGVDNGKQSEMYIKFSNLSSDLHGYIDTVGHYGNYTKYKYTITYNVGNFLGKNSYLYLYYYTKGNYIVVNGDDLEIRFSK